MSSILPPSADLEWLKKAAKRQVKEWRAQGRDAKLAEAQFALAREYGFASWRALKAHLDRSAQGVAEESIARFLRLIGTSDLEGAKDALTADPELVNAVGPHPFWGGRLQPLHLAIEGNRPAFFDLLLAHGADVVGRNADYDNWSPLMIAAREQRGDMVDRLQAKGAPTGLCEALLLRDDSALDAVLATTRWQDVPAPSGSLIALARTPYAVRRLVELQVPADTKDRWGSNAMDALSRLGAKGADLVATLDALGTAATLQDIARLGDLDRLKQQMALDPAAVHDPKVVMAAVDFGHLESVEWLLGQGANVNARHGFGSSGTALHSAAWNGDLAMVQCLLDHGANWQAVDAEHKTTPQVWAETAAVVTNNPKCQEVAALLSGLAEKQGN